jgi:hypothetical protein
LFCFLPFDLAFFFSPSSKGGEVMLMGGAFGSSEELDMVIHGRILWVLELEA